ncbi:MAG: carboxypeptidase-like regulatory domain-containing protein, partial [Planctomycetota bacterium]
EEVNPSSGGEYTLSFMTGKDYCPRRMKIEEFDKPLIIQLEPGSVATGQIIEAETGWPVPGVEVGAYLIGEGLERVSAEAKTDENGRFRFSNLKKGRTYSLSLTGCITTNSMGENITGGSSEEVRVEVELYESSKLKPRKPDETE